MAERVWRALVIVIVLGALWGCAGSAFVRVDLPDMKTGKEEVYHLDFRYFQIKRVWKERIMGENVGFVLVVVYCQKNRAFVTLLLREGHLWDYLRVPQMDQNLDERLFRADEKYNVWDERLSK